MKNMKMKTAILPNRSAEMKDQSAPNEKASRLLAAEHRIKKFNKIPDQIAEHDHWLKNEPMPFANELFPFEISRHQMRYADLFYPYAKGGPVYIDTPVNEYEISWCEQKLAYQKKGVRYTFVKPNEDVADALLRLHVGARESA